MDGTQPPAIRTTCPYCGVGCGVLARPHGAGGLAIEGDPDHPANKGRLCSKGLALGETLSLDDRLLAPQVNGAPASWDSALDLVAKRFSDTIAEHGSDSVAFYVSGQLLTECYYVANKLMKGYIGSANIDTNSRLCMASTVAGHKRAFGTDTVPGTYEDLDEADLVVLVGSNLAWCHPVLFQRLVAARQARGTKVVVVDPRRTSTCDIADLHLKLAPGSDVALFNALLQNLRKSGAYDEAFVRDHTEGLDDTLAGVASNDVSATGLSQADLDAFFRLFRETERCVTIFSQGVNQSTSGVDKVNAILNCHLLTGRIGRPGMGPFSVTGQPNAMGGREVGGLANMLAAHLDLENPQHRDAVQGFWASATIANAQGLKAVDMFDAVADGRIKAIWIACTNPVVSLPEADKVRAGLERCDFVVVSDVTGQTDTARLADVVLPAAAWGEKDGTVTNSDRTISRQKAALPAPGAARPDWEIFADVGRRMGWAEAFDYTNPAEVFREHARLSGVAGQLGRDFDISGLSEISDVDYEALAPVRWPVTATRVGGRFFGDGSFFTPSGKARFVPVSQKAPATKTAPRFPYRLNTGRLRDQWHTMTRTAKSARLSRHQAEPFLQLHPRDASDLGVGPADLVRVSAPGGAAILRVLISEDAAPGAPFAPMHWTAENAPASRVNALVQAEVDAISGQPESKASAVAIGRYAADWYGFSVSRSRPDQTLTGAVSYSATSRTDGGWRTEWAGQGAPDDWLAFVCARLGANGTAEVFADRSRTRIAIWQDGVLQAALFTAPKPVSVARDFVAAALVAPSADLLAARPAADRPDPGPTVCSCMSVGRNTILRAIEAAPDASLDHICDRTGAGVTCGSCRAEVADLIARAQVLEAAQ